MKILSTRFLSFIGITCSFLLSNINDANAQLTVTANQTAQALVASLVGDGVITSNATLNCATQANGKFSGTSNLGIDSGIVLTSGYAATVGINYGVNGVPGNSASNGMNRPGDADLTTLINSLTGGTITTHDACILEFDFIPAGDTVSFDYVFGSDEYTTYNCSINDVFGFFISGPGITGVRNIATVPGTNGVMVGISTVNDGTQYSPTQSNPCHANTLGNGPYTQYYVSNTNLPSTTLVYNGMTTVFQAVSAVQPCQTYHLKLAVADASDEILDSGVFLKAGSLKSVGLSATAEGMEVTQSDTAYTVRGCHPASVTVKRSTPSATPLDVPYLLQGTAVNGVDYQYLPGVVTIPANDTVATITIQPLLLPQPVGDRIVEVILENPYSCAGSVNQYLDTAYVLIRDSINVVPNLYVESLCVGQTLPLTIEYDEIFGPLEYQWTPANWVAAPTLGAATLSFPNQAGNYEYTLTVTLANASQSCRESTVKINVNVQDIYVNIGNDTTICDYESIYMFAEVNPIDSLNDYTYQWFPADKFNDPNVKNPIYNNSVSGNVVVKVETPIGCIGFDTMHVVVNPGNFINLSPTDTAICPNTEIQIVATSALDNPNINPANTYMWYPGRDVSDSTIVNPILRPTVSTEYMMVAKSQLGCYDTSMVNIQVYPEALVSLPSSVNIWAGESYQIAPNTNAMNFVWWPNSAINDVNISNPIVNPVTDTRYYYVATTQNGCTATDSIDVIVNQGKVFEMPNAFNPKTNPTIAPIIKGNVQLVGYEIYNRWGLQVFNTTIQGEGWDGRYQDMAQPMGVYAYIIYVKDATGAIQKYSGNITLIR